MKAVFISYLAFITMGLVYCVAIGVTHR